MTTLDYTPIPLGDASIGERIYSYPLKLDLGIVTEAYPTVIYCGEIGYGISPTQIVYVRNAET